jgi:hypothetical protein
MLICDKNNKSTNLVEAIKEEESTLIVNLMEVIAEVRNTKNKTHTSLPIVHICFSKRRVIKHRRLIISLIKADAHQVVVHLEVHL